MASELKIGGVTIDPAAGALAGYRLTPYSARGGRAAFEFARRVGELRAGPDPYLGQAVELWIDSTLRFSGDIDDVSEPFDSRLGWVQLYRCTDLRTRADRVPVTDPTHRLDSIVFNLPGDDIDFQGTRAGRSLGYIIKYSLEAPDTAARLDELGIGGYSSFGWGARASAEVSGGGLTITVDEPGEDYASPPAVVLVGGDGTYTAATATVSGGEVTGISLSGDTGWTEAPEVWIGTLPEATLRDLATLTFISPGPVAVQGDYILAAVDALLRSMEPNVCLHVRPDGTLWFLDLRTFAGPRIVIEGDGVGATARAVTDATGAVGGAEVLTGGADYTTATARAVGGGGSGATFTVNLDSGAVDSIAVDSGGSGYRYARTLTLGIDPVEPFGLQRDARGCYTRVVVRGQPEAEMVELRLSKGDLEEDFAHSGLTNTEAKEQWTLEDFEGGGRDAGTVTACTSTTVTVQSDDPDRAFAEDECSQLERKGNVFLRDSVASGIDSFVTRRVVANTAMAAGGTMTLTLDRPLPATGYDTYTLTFLAGGASKVWRQYRVTDDEIARRMLQYSSYELPIRNANGTAARMSSTPVLVIQYSDSGDPPYMEMPMGVTVDPDAGTILADRPVVTLFGNRSLLLKGGYPIDGEPSDVVLYVPVNKGDLEAIVPPDTSGGAPQYAGSAFTAQGLTRTLVTSLPSWRDPGQVDAVTDYAESVWGSVSDIPVEGQVSYRGLYADALDFGLALHLAGDGYATGWEDAALPVLDCELVWEEDGPDLYATRLGVSNRRQPYSAMNFLRPEPTGDALGAGLEGLNAGGLSAGVTFTGPVVGGFRDPSTWGASGPGAQAVMGMSQALRSGAIGPMGAAVRAAQAHVGAAQTMSPFTFGGNGGGGTTARGARTFNLGATPGAATVQNERERAARAQRWGPAGPLSFVRPADDDEIPWGVGG